MKPSSELFGDAFLRALHRWRRMPAAQPDLPPPPARMESFTVAISREAGCRGEAVACEVAALLDWPLYDRKLLEQTAAELGARPEDLEALDEKPPSWFAGVLQGLSGERDTTRRYARKLFKVIAILGDHGGAVIVGRGAPQMLPPGRTLRVRLIAPMEVRAVNFQSDQGIPLADARREIAAIDTERAKFVESYLRKRSDDLQHYDVVLNTSRFAPRAAAEIVVDALRKLYEGATVESATAGTAPRRHVAGGTGAK